ncbi:tetratricopeptide repeat protein [Clavibacter michiganensis]|uniref:Thioredoxin n=1 Tax=Clavibacter michiganensis subsp. michiganensis (strain NCPPB 382) TaxID=443906 RepID=A5CQT7_CLAM3|nr:tetratricopeptide repeat protein [Clavibacter michiganensis]MWJ80795.1 co-chaperone YbbN [Clavibacter michiganensis subsp. michiganensis]CAN01441.1 putative thioredoxin [Clavibacter michiganensis subsp. michiganensis NCPPB 382]
MTNVPPSAASLRGAVDLSSLVNRAQAPAAPAGASAGAAAAGAPGAPVPDAGAAGAPQTVDVPGLVLAADDASFTQFLDISSVVPVIVELVSTGLASSRELSPVLERVVTEQGGRVLLVRIDVDQSPQLGQAFQAQTVPTVAALIGGRPVGLFAGVIPEDQVRDVIQQVLELAQQNGVTGQAVAPDASAAPAAPVGEPLPPHHAEAYAFIEQGDYASAAAEYRTAIAQNPRDALAVAGLAQVSLLERLDGKAADEIRGAAAAAPDDVDAQLLVADLDLSGGHVEDAFTRLLELFPSADAAGREAVRQRLLEHFEVVGLEDPRVAVARRQLTRLLY